MGGDIMSIKEPMMYMIQQKIPSKTREKLVEDLFKLQNIKKGGSNESNKNYTSSDEKTSKS